MAGRTGQLDLLLPFKVDPANARERLGADLDRVASATTAVVLPKRVKCFKRSAHVACDVEAAFDELRSIPQPRGSIDGAIVA
jgi:hypothetical protein